MRILSYAPGHDGAAVLLEDGRLIHSIEGEKDDGARHAAPSLSVFLRSLSYDYPPDVVAISGRYKLPFWQLDNAAADARDLIGAGYWNEDAKGKTQGEILFAGHRLRIARQSGRHARVNQDDKGSRGVLIMRLLIDAGKR